MSSPPASAYLAAARARNIAWGHHRTCTPDQYERVVADAVRDPSLRAAVDAVWEVAETTIRHQLAAELRTTSGSLRGLPWQQRAADIVSGGGR